SRHGVPGRANMTDRHHVTDNLDAERLAQVRLGHLAERHPGGRLARARALEHRPRVLVPVLLHTGEIGVTGARAGERRAPRAAPRACPSSTSGAPGSGDIPVSPLGHSVFAIRIATGAPGVRPCRTPPVISTSSCSNFIRAPRP